MVFQKDGKDPVLLIEDYAYAKYLGHIELEFDDGGTLTAWSGNPILLDHTVQQGDSETRVHKHPFEISAAITFKTFQAQIFSIWNYFFNRNIANPIANFFLLSLSQFILGGSAALARMS